MPCQRFASGADRDVVHPAILDHLYLNRQLSRHSGDVPPPREAARARDVVRGSPSSPSESGAPHKQAKFADQDHGLTLATFVPKDPLGHEETSPDGRSTSHCLWGRVSDDNTVYERRERRHDKGPVDGTSVLGASALPRRSAPAPVAGSRLPAPDTEAGGTLKVVNPRLRSGLTAPLGIAVNSVATREVSEGVDLPVHRRAAAGRCERRRDHGSHPSHFEDRRVRCRRSSSGRAAMERGLRTCEGDRGTGHPPERLGNRQARESLSGGHGVGRCDARPEARGAARRCDDSERAIDHSSAASCQLRTRCSSRYPPGRTASRSLRSTAPST